MSALDRVVLAEKAAALERHLARVSQRLPADPADFQPGTDASDAVILHLWQAVQLVIDLALAACMGLKLGTPENYGEAFLRLAEAGHLDEELAGRLVQAAGFRNRVVHGYEKLDMLRVHRAATAGPAHLRAFVAALRDALPES
jgi:uncharacterized protein YutE (UPF0331/DUF86 family)